MPIGFSIGVGLGVITKLPVASAGNPPVNTVAPVISGTAETGQTLSTTNGTWTGDATITYAYQWKRNGANIGGATASTYVLVVADEAASITCTVTGTNGAGSSSGNSNTIVPYDTDAAAWFAANASGGTSVDTATKAAITAFYSGLKADSIYTLIDRMHLVAAHDSYGARLDMKDKTTLMTPGGSPTFTAFRGYQGDAVSADVNTNWNSVSPAGNYTQNSAGVTTYINATLNDTGDAKASIGRGTSVITFIRPRVTTTNVMEGRCQVSSTTKTYGVMASRLGFRSISRTASNLVRGYGPDGLQSGTDDTNASTALVNENFRLLRLQSSYAGDRIAFWAAHGGFTAAQTLSFRNRITTLLTALGAN